MKYIVELILVIVITFFVWNMLKRLFFTQFYKNPKQQEPHFEPKDNAKSKIGQKVNWDAETVDYEEVKEDQKNN